MDDQKPVEPVEENKKVKPEETQAVEPVEAVEVKVEEENKEKLEEPKEETVEPEKPEEETKDAEKVKMTEETKPSFAEATDGKEEEKTEEPEEIEKEVEKPTTKPAEKGDWFIIHTYSGHEDKVAKSLKQRIDAMGFEDRVFEIIVPTRQITRVSHGKKENIKEKIFPGYVLVRMSLDDETWLLIRTTQGVTAFVGTGNKPTPISKKEVEAIRKFMNLEEPLYKAAFTVGEAVKIVDGPFSDFLGTISEIDDKKGKIKVLVSIFGRETPVELDFLQVNKL